MNNWYNNRLWCNTFFDAHDWALTKGGKQSHEIQKPNGFFTFIFVSVWDTSAGIGSAVQPTGTGDLLQDNKKKAQD